MAEIVTDGKPDFLVDGYIAHSLSPEQAEKYISRFLKCLAEEPGASLFPFERGWIVQRPLMTDVTATSLTTTRQSKRRKTERQAPVLQEEELVGIHRSLFDCQVDLHTGTVVPQTTWVGISQQTGAQTPVFFVLCDGSFGIPYEHLEWRNSLQNAKAEVPPMLKRCNLNMRLRIKWPGYKLFYYEFRIYDKKLGENVPITMSRLVERVARGIHRLYFEAVPDPHEFDERWKLGKDGIQLNDIMIVGLLHISKGAWLPILQLTRHVGPRYEFEIDRKRGIYMCP